MSKLSKAATPVFSDGGDPLGARKEEKALRHFKDVMAHLLVMLRISARAETACMLWVNRSRGQFVMETNDTVYNEVVFQDRVAFDDHFLAQWKDLKESIILRVGDEIQMESLHHHVDTVPANEIMLLPFVNNGETVAITFVEMSEQASGDSDFDLEQAAGSYLGALANILRTYLELSDLLQDEKQWEPYDQLLLEYSDRKSAIDILVKMVKDARREVPTGGACLLARGHDGWQVVIQSPGSDKPYPIGVMMTEQSQAFTALKAGEPQFCLHFNSNPKRVASREPQFSGASLAVPVMVQDRRQALLLVWDTNPMAFRETVKHKIINLGKVVSLVLNSSRYGITVDTTLLSGENGAFMIEVAERCIENALKMAKLGESQYEMHVGFVTIANYQDLRARVRLETLRELQQYFVKAINPATLGYTGFVSGYAESVYVVILEGRDEGIFSGWMDDAKDKLQAEINTILRENQPSDIDLTAGFAKVSEHHTDSYGVIQEAKKKMNENVRKTGSS